MNSINEMIPVGKIGRNSINPKSISHYNTPTKLTKVCIFNTHKP